VAFPRKLLAPGEEIFLEAHPNWSILVPRLALFLLVLAGCVAGVVTWTRAPLWMGWVFLGVAGVCFLWVVAKVGVWRSTSLVLTNRRVVYRTGLLRRLGREIPLDRVQDVTYSQSLGERLVGAGSLRIQSAGAGGDEPFPDIRHPAAVQSLINRLISPPAPAPGYGSVTYPSPRGYLQPQHPPPSPQPEYQAAQYPPQPLPSQTPAPQQYAPPSAPPPPAPQQYAPAPPPPPMTPADVSDSPASSSRAQLQHLGEMFHLGVITEAEYEAKRRELLEGR